MSENEEGEPSMKNGPKNYIMSILKQDLPKSDYREDVHWKFILKKFPIKHKPKRIRKKKQFLTRKERKQMGLLKLMKTGWNYEKLIPIRELWKEYMRKNIGKLDKAPTCEDSNWGNISVALAKSEFVGAEVTVVRSTVPNTIGISGIIVLETKGAFHIITPKSEFKTLLKIPSVFSFTLDNIKFTLFGKHINVKPTDRSSKKIKSQLIPDL